MGSSTMAKETIIDHGHNKYCNISRGIIAICVSNIERAHVHGTLHSTLDCFAQTLADQMFINLQLPSSVTMTQAKRNLESTKPLRPLPCNVLLPGSACVHL